MATRIVMSKLSPTMEEGRILRWVKKEGDPVESGDVVVEVETDKATMEVEAMGSGVLRVILVEENSTVPTGTLLAVVAAADEDISNLISDAAEQETAAVAATAAAQAPTPVEKPDSSPAALPEAAPAPAAGTAGDGGRLKASPLARRMAQDSGIALQQVRGTGTGGRIIKRDIEAAIQGGAVEAGPEAPFERIELTQIRKAIAKNLVQSMGPIPHFFLTTEIDMGDALEFRAKL
ncbi:MAG TPA: biotin/lipoyl-containing protein, partial [Gemmatimonadota bacterium]|nr:biotin/lipoyl-containing protein [Gemmatimonadota bacterium]